jgi:hypothetical protein
MFKGLHGLFVQRLVSGVLTSPFTLQMHGTQ